MTQDATTQGPVAAVEPLRAEVAQALLDYATGLIHVTGAQKLGNLLVELSVEPPYALQGPPSRRGSR